MNFSLNRASLFLALTLSATAAIAEEIKPFADSSRLVSVGGAVTEIIYALGEEDLLVARDSTATYPAEVADVPNVGYMRALSPEGVMSVDPTALLVIEGSGPPEVLDVLRNSGVPYQTVPDMPTHEGILEKVRAVGAALDRDDAAAELVAKIDAELAEAEALTSDIENRKRVLFILSTEGDKLMVSGTNSAADGIIALAGAVNAVTEFPGYKSLTHEAIIAAQPDVLLMMDRGGSHGAVDEVLFSDPAIMLTPAGKSKSIIRMDGGYLLGFGPRTASAIKDLAKALYGDEVK